MKWISVEDRLPEHGDEVIATNGELVKSSYFHMWDNGPSWSMCGHNLKQSPVKYWMPMPKPPSCEWKTRIIGEIND
jgi:Protein of unknown function (DUF551)